MGTVYLAEDLRLPGRRCAVKELSPALLSPHDQAWAVPAFQREAHLLASLSHPNLAAVTDFFPEGENWYLVMEFVEGETLARRLERSPGHRLPLQEALPIIRQLCDVLEYLHTRQPPVIFRDLKPSNIVLTPEGRVKLIDFGIARFFKPGQRQDTVNLGTPGYAAPEQYGGLGQSDPRTDIYSLGVLLHQMMTGYDPAAAAVPFPLPPPRQLMPGIPPEVERVILRATQIQPDARYPSIQALRDDLLPPTQVIPPPPPAIPRAPSVTPSQRPRLIPLSCTLEEAMGHVLQDRRRGWVESILSQLTAIEEKPVEGRPIVLVGASGIGMTFLVKQIMRGSRRKYRGPIMVVYTNPDPEEILRTLKRERGQLKFWLQKPILKFYQLYSEPIQEIISEITSSQIEAGLPIQLTFQIPFITLTLGNPLHYQRTWKKSKTSPTTMAGITRPLSTEQITFEPEKQLVATLRALVDYLCERRVRLMLILDRAESVSDLAPLREIIQTPGVGTLIITNNLDDLVQWQSINPKKVYYIPRLWGFAQDVFDRLLLNRPERNAEEVINLVRYAEFYTRGAPRDFENILTQEQFYIQPSPTPKLQLPSDFHRIEKLARVQEALHSQEDWILQDIRCRTDLLESRECDQIRTALYRWADYVLRGELNSKRELEKRAILEISCLLRIRDIRSLVDRLIQALKEAGVTIGKSSS
jgi:serine/threonine protein kinase